MRSPTTEPRIIHHRPIEELADSLQNSWKSVCECTARFLREVYEFDLRQGYKEWGYMDTAEWLDFKCGISRVTAREKVRIAKCLVVLSKVEKAFAEGFELVGRSPRQSTALPSENGPTLMSALGVVGDERCGRMPATTPLRSAGARREAGNRG